ncbi:MAG TPA: hypothetical protein VN773_12985 [Verrucomicrobiae bacterium]|jgi:hypothetical protein|nr:hypothetical protein [Verrucomicrobiae bacterium]
MHASLRAIRALTIALAVLLPAAPAVAAAGPGRPIPGHHPRFVTEREAGRWQDCLWASAAMLVDKWTAGRTVISKDALRRLSGDVHGGSNLDHLVRALRKIGISARTSPHGGATITWTSLRARLSAGGGAIVLGDDSRLPRWYGRWDPAFWGNSGDKDNHAVYLDRYDRATDRYWIMDPLAPADWTGEWISGRDLRAYAWSTSAGRLFGLMTPAAARPSFSGVRLRAPIASLGLNEVHVGWAIARSPRSWRRPPVNLVVSVAAATGIPTRGEVALSAPPVKSAVGATGLAAPVARPSVRFGSGMLNATVPYPAAGGTYQVAVVVRQRHLKATVARSVLTLYVPGERWATIAATRPSGPVPVGRLELAADVANGGSVSWADSLVDPSVPLALSTPRNTRLVATWILVAATPSTRAGAVAGAAPGAPAKLVAPVAPASTAVGPLSLVPGQRTTLTGSIATPVTPGRWMLVLDIVDDIDGSFASHGSRPAAILLDIVEPVGGQLPLN